MRYAIMATRVFFDAGSGGTRWRRLDNLIPTFYLDADSEEEATIKAKAVLGQCAEVNVSAAPCERDTTVRDVVPVLMLELGMMKPVQTGRGGSWLSTSREAWTTMREAVTRLKEQF